MLEVAGLEVRYGAIRAVRDISLKVAAGELVALIGANGAGKSSTLMCIAGALKAAGGSVHLDGEDITSAKPETIVRRGIATVPETRDVFPDLTVDENLMLGGYVRRSDTAGFAEDRAKMLALFPRLAERGSQPAGTLSGGEQQMLVIARAMMSRPKVLLLDEPSLGLAPVVVDQILAMIATLKAAGTTILLVEQNVAKALSVADRAYVMRLGRIAASGTAAEIGAATDLSTLYLGA
jgi:branched-chain amino acid transport system ATP-binding protein